ncbi:MAG TPA: hypothetical protein VM287_11675 [Egibacteraceae bacterium]|nr:hypothetical protein [Egibacteraceae bacterium]
MTPQHRAATEDLRVAIDRDDDDAVREALDRLTRRDDEPGPPIEPPRPLGPGEVVCRSCRLVARRARMDGTVLLVCEDCYRA